MPAAPPPLDAVRTQAITRGFGSRTARRRAWLALAGVAAPPARRHPGPHPTPHQIALDVARAFHLRECTRWDAGMYDTASTALAAALSTAFAPATGRHYYQGAHALSLIFLLEVGGGRATPTLDDILDTVFGDEQAGCSAPTLRPALALLELFNTLLGRASPALSSRLASLQLPLGFALPWILTWFAHSVRSLPSAVRFIDVILATHPLMPLYLGAALCSAHEPALLELSDDGDTGALHAALSALPARYDDDPRGLEGVIAVAVAAYREFPPESLLANGPSAPLATLRAEWPGLFTYAQRHGGDSVGRGWTVGAPSPAVAAAAAAALVVGVAAVFPFLQRVVG